MKKLILGLLVLMTFSCGSGRIATTETKQTETIVFGKLTIESDKALINKKILMHFNERLWGKHAVWLDESGYFYLKMPLGNNFIALLEYRDGGYYKNIPDNYISINVPLTDKIYYIGDISLVWTPSATDKRNNAGGVVGVLAEASKKGEKVNVSVSESDAAINYFKQMFPNNEKEIITSLAITNN
ncbi:hypothetical protein Barb4_02449 [Bacteroidales bacterium Barb4]|nr:hypothetical protein Barb4_02449 [Bacteroidales bacterium Barb4]